MNLLRDKRCAVCGRVYRGAYNSTRCPDCQKVYLRAYAWHRQNSKRKGEAIDNKAAHEHADRIAREAARIDATTEGRCLYCGKKLGNTKRKYCPPCVKNGLANVHEVTGRTNGWNKRRGKNEELKPGWRGQMVMGCGSSNVRPKS